MGKRLLGELELNRIYQRECIEGMRMIPDKSIDMILCDLPYGTTQARWDTVIPFDKLWEQYERIVKENGAIVLTASQPFSSILITSNLKMFKCVWYWDKVRATGFLNAKKQPLRVVEDVCVFYKKQPTYNPQFTKGKVHGTGGSKETINKREIYGDFTDGTVPKYTDVYYPKNLVRFSPERGLHPTQKPVALFAYLIRTYTNEGEIVLDNCMGSGTTAIAALRTGRQFIGFELEREYVEIANKRIDNELEANLWAQSKWM
jgi:site-specific DNA-methyltransferase (adenine-specific)